jgi:hypothetical protein
MTARSLRSPAVLMAIYVAAFICGGPWLGSGSTAHRNAPQIAIAVLLAVFAARGSRSARVLMITYSVLGVFVVFVGSTLRGPSEPLAASFLALTCVLVQIGLLVSTPMYQRTRRGWSPGQFQAGQFLPWPKLWEVLASAAGGLVMALLPFSDGIRETACSAGGARSVQPCGAGGFGYPIAYRFAYNNLAPRGIDFAAFAMDLELWTLSILLVLYLLQVSRSRESADPDGRPAVEPIPDVRNSPTADSSTTHSTPA